MVLMYYGPTSPPYLTASPLPIFVVVNIIIILKQAKQNEEDNNNLHEAQRGFD